MSETEITLVDSSLQKLLQVGKEYPNSDLDFSVAYVSPTGVSLLRPLLKSTKCKRAVVGLCLINRVNAFLELQDFGVEVYVYVTDSIRGLFWEGNRKKNESPAFGFQIDARGMSLMTDMFRFTPAMLEVNRDVVIDDQLGSELEDVVASMRRLETYEIGGEQYKRVPSGYDTKQRRADLLRYGGLYAFSPRIQASDVLTPALVDICYAHFECMAPLYHWLMKMVAR